MKYILSLFFVLVLGTACQEKKYSQAELEDKLKQTMKDYLVKTSNPGITVTVKEVIFYDEKNQFICEFKVNMRSATKDTTGTMSAIISSDFKKVERSQ